MRLRFLLLIWYFYAWTQAGQLMSIGPYENEERCEYIRVAVVEYALASPLRGYVEHGCWLLV
jgi:hypothetical protein